MSIDELVEELELIADQQKYRGSLPPGHPKLDDIPEDADLHEMADSLLLTYINDGRVMSAFSRIGR